MSAQRWASTSKHLCTVSEYAIVTSMTLGRRLNSQSYTLNIWDVGGQRTLRPYWRNYFEQTDALVWVVDSGDRLRMGDCKEELHSLLLEDVRLQVEPD
jgi:GTPase SAR1 family protein